MCCRCSAMYLSTYLPTYIVAIFYFISFHFTLWPQNLGHFSKYTYIYVSCRCARCHGIAKVSFWLITYRIINSALKVVLFLEIDGDSNALLIGRENITSVANSHQSTDACTYAVSSVAGRCWCIPVLCCCCYFFLSLYAYKIAQTSTWA